VGHGLRPVADDLAEEEVQALDGGRALVERVDLGVADVLLDGVLLQEAGAAEGLQRLGAQQDPDVLRPEALDDREEQAVVVTRGGAACRSYGSGRSPGRGSWSSRAH
jgi:hypothetical protein